MGVRGEAGQRAVVSCGPRHLLRHERGGGRAAEQRPPGQPCMAGNDARVGRPDTLPAGRQCLRRHLPQRAQRSWQSTRFSNTARHAPHMPVLVHRVPMEAAPHVVVHAARGHALQAERRHVQHAGCERGKAGARACARSWRAQPSASSRLQLHVPGDRATHQPPQPPAGAARACLHFPPPQLARTCALRIPRRRQPGVLRQQSIDLGGARELGRPAKAAQAAVETGGQLGDAAVNGAALLLRRQRLLRGLGSGQGKGGHREGAHTIRRWAPPLGLPPNGQAPSAHRPPVQGGQAGRQADCASSAESGQAAIGEPAFALAPAPHGPTSGLSSSPSCSMERPEDALISSFFASQICAGEGHSGLADKAAGATPEPGAPLSRPGRCPHLGDLAKHRLEAGPIVRVGGREVGACSKRGGQQTESSVTQLRMHVQREGRWTHWRPHAACTGAEAGAAPSTPAGMPALGQLAAAGSPSIAGGQERGCQS